MDKELKPWRPLLRQLAREEPVLGLKIAMWCEYGYKHAQDQLAAMGRKVSISRLRSFFNWWDLRMAFEGADSKTRTYEDQLREHFPDATEEEIVLSAQEFFERLAMERQDVKEYCQLQHLRLAERRMALLEEKAERSREKLAAKRGGISAETLAQIETAAKLL